MTTVHKVRIPATKPTSRHAETHQDTIPAEFLDIQVAHLDPPYSKFTFHIRCVPDSPTITFRVILNSGASRLRVPSLYSTFVYTPIGLLYRAESFGLPPCADQRLIARMHWHHLAQISLEKLVGDPPVR